MGSLRSPTSSIHVSAGWLREFVSTKSASGTAGTCGAVAGRMGVEQHGSGFACGFSEPGAELLGLGLVRGCPRAAGVSAPSNSSVPC